MEVSFNRNQESVVDVTATVTPAPALSAASSATIEVPVAVQSGSLASGSRLVLGDKIPDFEDIIIPRLNIVQNIGELKDTFEPGALVYNQSVILFLPPKVNSKTNVQERPATPPVTMVFFGFRPTRFAEKIEGGNRGLIVDSEDAVRANGGTLDYAEWKLKKETGIRRFEPLADALVAIQRPAACADDDTVFVYDVDSAKYTLGLWAMKGTVYTALAKRVLFTSRATGCLRKSGYPSWSYSVTTRENKYENGHAAWVPVALPNKATTPAFLEFVRSIIGG